MIAQAYYDDPNNMIVRVFQNQNGYYRYIADLPLSEATPESADFALERIRLRRKGSWTEIQHGKEAKVYFV